MDSYYDSDESDMDCDVVWNVIVMRREKKIRDRPDLFNSYDECDFRNRFRLTKEAAWHTFNLIRDKLEVGARNHPLDPLAKFLLTLRFYATGNFQITVGDFFGVSASTASRCITDVSHHIALLRPQFIKMPANDESIAQLQTSFYKIVKFPRVIGAMDCTHVKICSPGGDDAELFRNRKGYFSVNVQTICDSNLKISNMVARWPGSVHDSRIFKNSRVYNDLEMKKFKTGIVIGDSGYENSNTVLTPLLAPRTAAEKLYNESHIRTRNCVERSYGVWKRRFPILAMGIRMRLEKVSSIIVATAVLHNICCIYKDCDAPPVYPEQETAINNSLTFQTIAFQNNNVTISANKNETRNLLINNHFRNL